MIDLSHWIYQDEFSTRYPIGTLFISYNMNKDAKETYKLISNTPLILYEQEEHRLWYLNKNRNENELLWNLIPERDLSIGDVITIPSGNNKQLIIEEENLDTK